MIKTIQVLIAISFLAFPSFAQSIQQMKGIPQLEWQLEKRYSEYKGQDYLQYSFSKANLKEEKNIRGVLDFCTCKEVNDSIIVRLVTRQMEGGIAIILKIHQNSFNSYIEHYSDIMEFEGDKYSVEYPTESQSLQLDRTIVNGQEALVGILEIKSVPMSTIEGKAVSYKGQFQCIVAKK
ncbi:hypothetical protein [Nibribacter koreensis]|uniref:DUF4251 domain-containing protein n=1 Tax=Nibribacter koreensis TaxID=1084519 RepID=A0ABP8FEI6_9BACT